MSRPLTELYPQRPFSIKVMCRCLVDMSHGNHSPYRLDRHMLPRMAVPAPGQWQPLSTLNSEPKQELWVSFSQAYGCRISSHPGPALPHHILLRMIHWHSRGEDKPQLILAPAFGVSMCGAQHSRWKVTWKGVWTCDPSASECTLECPSWAGYVALA